MARRKQLKFLQNQHRNNVLEPGKEVYNELKGNWHEHIFKNHSDIVLELACGRGEYTTGLAAVHPNQNFVGADLKGDRIWYGSKVALEQQLENVRFLRCQIQFLNEFFAPGEVSEIWLTFPDPRPRRKDTKRRLTYPRFLKLYQQVLKPDGWFRLKTDNRGLFEYSLETLQKYGVTDLAYTFNLYESPLAAEHHGIVTRYERIFTAEGHDIHYLKCKLPPLPPQNEGEAV